MLDKLAKKIQQGWSEPNLVTYLLLPLSMFYRLIMSLRKLFYKKGLFGVYQAEIPVVVVGNISVGGTGKTPLTMAIVERARMLGFKPGVISRGYGGQALEWPQIVEPETSAHFVGDEAVLIARQAACPVVVAPNRGEAINLLLANNDCDIIFSDDGLQHYALDRDVEIAVIDKQRRHLNNFCLPAGPLRESTNRLLTVDIILNHVSPNDLDKDFIASSENLFRLRQTGFKSVVNDQEQILVKNKTIHAVAGIGHPIRFFRQLRALGLNIVEHSFPDHHRYSIEDFQFSDDDSAIIMTAKDAVKCIAFAKPDWLYLAVEVEMNTLAAKNIDQTLKNLREI